MLAEALAWLLTPTSATARRMGHLAESIAIAARHRRCRAAWAPHLAASHRALLDSAQRAPSHRRALVLGSGHLLDVPLAELAMLFEEVWLVDIVQPWSSRHQARRYDNVRLIERDLTECLDRMPAEPCLPSGFLDDGRISWVASVNLLSQLASLPQGWLHERRPDLAESAVSRYGEALMANHLEWLSRFRAPVCLLADIEQTTLDAHGIVLDGQDFRPLLADWRVLSEWRWDLAPTGELTGGQSAFHRVAALARQRQDEYQRDIQQAQCQVGGHQEPDPVQGRAGGGPVLGGHRAPQRAIRHEIDEDEDRGHQVADPRHGMDVDRNRRHAAQLRDEQLAADDQQQDRRPDPGKETPEHAVPQPQP